MLHKCRSFHLHQSPRDAHLAAQWEHLHCASAAVHGGNSPQSSQRQLGWQMNAVLVNSARHPHMNYKNG